MARAALRAVTEDIRQRQPPAPDDAAHEASGDPAWPAPARSGSVKEAAPAYRPDSREADDGTSSIDVEPWEPPPTPFRGAPPQDVPLRELEYAVVDIETTGGSPIAGHRMTEVAVVRVRGTGEIAGEYATLVNPFRPIPRGITRLTNITNEMVAEAPAFRDVAHIVRRATEGRVFVAHNAGFDLRFLAIELLRATGRPYERDPLCTVRMSRRLLPEVRRRTLDSVCGYFGIPIENRHRALGDARATAVLLGRLLERAEEQSILSWGMLDALLSRRKKRRKRSALPRSMDCA